VSCLLGTSTTDRSCSTTAYPCTTDSSCSTTAYQYQVLPSAHPFSDNKKRSSRATGTPWTAPTASRNLPCMAPVGRSLGPVELVLIASKNKSRVSVPWRLQHTWIVQLNPGTRVASTLFFYFFKKKRRRKDGEEIGEDRPVWSCGWFARNGHASNLPVPGTRNLYLTGWRELCCPFIPRTHSMVLLCV